MPLVQIKLYSLLPASGAGIRSYLAGGVPRSPGKPYRLRSDRLPRCQGSMSSCCRFCKSWPPFRASGANHCHRGRPRPGRPPLPPFISGVKGGSNRMDDFFPPAARTAERLAQRWKYPLRTFSAEVLPYLKSTEALPIAVSIVGSDYAEACLIKAVLADEGSTVVIRLLATIWIAGFLRYLRRPTDEENYKEKRSGTGGALPHTMDPHGRAILQS